MCCTVAVIIALFLSAFSFRAMGQKKQPVKQQDVVNVQAILDSALIMADSYATSLTEKPEMAGAYINQFRNFYSRQPQIAQDSVRSLIYTMMARYMDEKRMDRCEAFKNCYMIIAKAQDERMGNIFAAELALAYEEDDTMEVNRVLGLLEGYANRTNYDFDTEIAEAKDYLHYMRSRKPINEALMGVWVCEQIGKERPYRENVFKTIFTLDNSHGSRFHKLSHPYFLSITNNRILTEIVSCYKDFPRVGYRIPEDILALGKYQKQTSYLFDRMPNSLNGVEYWNTYPQVMQYDEKLRSAYALWSSETIKSFNPDFYAQLRQTIQQTSATAIGNTARKNVSMNKRIRTQAAVGAMDIVSNSIINLLTVSTAVTSVREMTVQQDSPNSLTAWIYTQYNKTRSDTGQTTTWDKDYDGVKYYKWEPNDSVFFLGKDYEEFITLPSKFSHQDKKKMKKYFKEQRRLYKAEIGRLITMKDYDRFLVWFNNNMLNKLKAKAEQQK